MADDQVTAWVQERLRDIPLDPHVRRQASELVRIAVTPDGDDEIHMLVAQRFNQGSEHFRLRVDYRAEGGVDQGRAR